MSNPKVILLDMDGVCCDFVGAVCKLFGRDPAEVSSWNISDDLGVSPSVFWTAINSRGSTFWETLKPLPWFEELYKTCTEIAPTCFCSAPTRSPNCVAGKLAWLQARFGDTFRDYIFTARKELLARPGVLLIDDRRKNVERFLAAGGDGVLFPRPWSGEPFGANTPNVLVSTFRQAMSYDQARHRAFEDNLKTSKETPRVQT